MTAYWLLTDGEVGELAAGWSGVRRVRKSNIVRAILYLAGGSRFADAAKELADGGSTASGDFSEVPAEQAERLLARASHEFRHADEGDLNAAEAALEDLLAAAPKRETMGRALRDAEALRVYLLNQGGRTRRNELLSEDAQHYFDALLDLTCQFIARTVHGTDLAGQAERAGIAELLTGVDRLREQNTELLELATGRQEPGSTPRVDLLASVRLAGERARQSAQPEILPSMDRLAALQRAVGAVDDRRTPLAIIGEGGLGKSVLAGQIFDRLRSAGQAEPIFIPCTRIPASADLSSATAVDLAFGHAAAGDHQADSLTAILSMLPSRAVVIVDTLDLILTENNADDVSYVLRRAAQTAALFMTCRDQEWHSYLESDRDLTGSLYHLPRLARYEIRKFADAYVQASGIRHDSRDAFVASLSQRVSAPAVRDIFSSPLRLAMACDIYAASGAVPAGLTVTRLYNAYWDRRVSRDRRGRRADRARYQVRTAEALADSVWEASDGRFVEFVPETTSMSASGLNDLLSEGTIKVIGGRYAFFHQTYAEFAVGRQLAVQGTAADLDRLENGLRAGWPGYWAIAKHLLMLEIAPERRQEVTAHVPRDSVEGIRLHFQSALAQGDPQLVAQLVSDLKDNHPELLLAAVGVLDSAVGTCVGPALETAMWCMRHAERSSFPRVAVTAATLIRSAEPDEQTAALEEALNIALGRVADYGPTHMGPVVRRLLEQTVSAGATGVELRMLINRYADLPDPARAELIGVVHSSPDAGRSLEADLIVHALRHRCPSGAVDVVVDTLVRVWKDPQVQAAAGWSDWRSMLAADLPQLWDTCQVRLMLRFCADRATASALLEATFDRDRSIERSRLTHAVILLAATDPDFVTRAVIAAPHTTVNGVVGTFATVANHVADQVDAGTRRELADALDSYLTDHPRKIWPAVMRLSSADPDRLRRYLARLNHFAAEDAGGLMHGPISVRRGFDAILTSAKPAVVRELEAELRPLCSSPDPADRQRMGRLQGRMTPVSTVAREWILRQLLQGDSQKVARDAAKTVAASLDDWDEKELQDVGMSWLLELLGSKHASAVRELVDAVVARRKVLTLPADWRPVAVDRLIRSLADGEDAQVQTALIRLVAAIDREIGISTAEVKVIMEAYLTTVRSALEPSSGSNPHSVSTAYARLLDAITTLALGHLELDELSDLVVDVLTTIDSAAVARHATHDADRAGRPRRNLEAMLVGVVQNEPLILPRLEEAWPRSSASNKAAIADCVSVVETGTAGIVSLRLARRADCPPEVSSALHARFGG